VVSSKVFFGTKGNLAQPNEKGLSRKHIVEACNAALKRMQVEYLDLFFVPPPRPQCTYGRSGVYNELSDAARQKYFIGEPANGVQPKLWKHIPLHAKNHLVGPVVEQPEYKHVCANKNGTRLFAHF
jgi:aryl-alcohol dehydrogenase-like predicted oxidoreductase